MSLTKVTYSMIENPATLDSVISPTDTNFYQFNVEDSAQVADRVNGLLLEQNIRAGVTGIRQCLTGIARHWEPSNNDDDHNFYVGVQAGCFSYKGDGGTVGTSKGAYFGINSYVEMQADAKYTANVTSAEFNVTLLTGSSTLYRSGIQIAGGGDVQGSTVDAAIVISNLTTATVPWKKGILFGNFNGSASLGTTGTAIEIIETQIQDGIQFGLTNVTGAYLSGVNLVLSNGIAQFTAPNQVVYIGNRTTVNTPKLDFFSSGNTGPDVVMKTTGGTGAEDGTLTISLGNLVFAGLKSSSAGLPSGSLWFDPTDGNRVKYVP